MASQVTCELIDFSESKLLSSAYEDNHNLIQLSKFLPYVPFLINLFTHDSYWIERMFGEENHSLVFRFLKKLPKWLLKRKDFWEKGFTEKKSKSRKDFDGYFIETIEKLDQLDQEEIELVKQIAINALESVDQQFAERELEFARKFKENQELMLNHDFVLEGVRHGYLPKEDIPKSLLEDKEFVIRLLQIVPYYCTIVSNELLQDMEYMKMLIKICPIALSYDMKRESKEMLIDSITHGLPIYYIGDIEPWENDEDVVLKAVEMDDYVINELPDKFRTDNQFLMKAVLVNGMNYKYYSYGLKTLIQNLDEFEIGLVAKRACCIKIIEKKFNSEEELEKIVEINPFVLNFIPNFGMTLLKKAATVLVEQFKNIERNGGQNECRDWQDLLEKLDKRPNMSVMANKIFIYEN